MVKLDEKISYNKEITTINELDKKGIIEYTILECDSKKTASGSSFRHFAHIKNTEYYIEISKYAYQSKTKKKEEPVYVDGILISKEAINAFNNKKEVSFNDNWNKAKKLGTLKENSILRKISNYFGEPKLNFGDIMVYNRQIESRIKKTA